MAKIKLRLRKNGEPSYTVEVRVCGVQSSKTFHNKKDAQIWAVSTEAALREGRYGEFSVSKNYRVSDAIERFFIAPPVNNGEWLTGKSRNHFLNFWNQTLGHIKLVDLRPANIVKGRDKLLSKGSSPATCNRYVSAISTVMQACVEEWFWLETNPVQAIRRMKEINS